MIFVVGQGKKQGKHREFENAPPPTKTMENSSKGPIIVNGKVVSMEMG